MGKRFAGLVTATLFFAMPFTASAAEPLSPEQKEAVKALIRETLISNPELLEEAMGILVKKREEQEMAERKAELDRMGAAAATHRAALERDAKDPTFGPSDADVTIVEFFDYRCPYCKQVADRVLNVAKADKKVRVVFKEYPILGPQSVVAARAAIAAQALGKYVEFHQALMAWKGQMDVDSILKVATSVGLNADKMKTEMAKPEVEDRLRTVMSLGRSIGISGTPAFLIGKQLVPGAVDEDYLKQLIADARAAK
ncbi:DsbA family protein [Lacibacterium aquatile]|uniref:DsbA family protein n=1 Tax=Lacibacterium aquatile TaxID=1168082 RepID=A0ABW5DVI6_9PROT